VCRLNISSSPNSPDTSVQSSRKRRRVDVADASVTAESRRSSESYVTLSTAAVGIEIREVDADANFIRLYNTTDEVIIVFFVDEVD